MGYEETSVTCNIFILLKTANVAGIMRSEGYKETFYNVFYISTTHLKLNLLNVFLQLVLLIQCFSLLRQTSSDWLQKKGPSLLACLAWAKHGRVFDNSRVEEQLSVPIISTFQVVAKVESL